MAGSLRLKITFALLIVTICGWGPAFTLLYIAEQKGEEETITPALIVARNGVKTDLISSFEALTTEINIRARAPAARGALHDFEEAVYRIDEDMIKAGASLRKKYEIKADGAPKPDDALSMYSAAHAKHHPTFIGVAGRYGLADIALIEANTGFCFYSTSKTELFGATIIAPPAKFKTLAGHLQRLFGKKKGSILFTKFIENKSGAATAIGGAATAIGGVATANTLQVGQFGGAATAIGDTATAYVIAPIPGNGEIAGAIVFTVTDEIIRGAFNRLIAPPAITYHSALIRISDNKIIAQDNRSEADSFDFIKNIPDVATTAGVTETRNGYAAFTPVSLGGEEYALIIETPSKGVTEKSRRALYLLIVTLAPGLAVAIFAFILIYFALFPKIKNLETALKSVAKTGATPDEPHKAVDRKSEIGQLLELTEDIAMVMDAKEKDATQKQEALLLAIESEEEKTGRGGGSRSWRKLADLSQKEADALSERSGQYESKLEELTGKLNAATEKLKTATDEKTEIVERLWPRLAADLKEAIRTIKESSDQKSVQPMLERLLAQAVASFSRLTWEKIDRPELFASVDLAALARNEMKKTESIAQSKSVSLHFKAATGNMRVKADAGRIENVVTELLKNAVAHTPKGGEVAMQVYGAGTMIALEVTDSGKGVLKEDRDKIFEKYYRGKNADVVHPGGAGVGLSFCRSVIKGHDGRIGMKDIKSGGSLFFFQLPKTSAPEQRSLF